MVEFAGCRSEKTTIPVIAWVFQPFGIPEDFKSDNGPPLTVLKYRKYVQEEGFKHCKVTLGWSEANGDIERHMQRIKKTATATLQLLLYQLTNEIAHQGFWIYNWLKTITWFWRWLSNRLSRRQSPTIVLLGTPITQIIIFNKGMFLLGSNHFLITSCAALYIVCL